MNFRRFLLPFLCVLILISCSVQKRRYRNGFHLEALHTKAAKNDDKLLQKMPRPMAGEELSSLSTAPDINGTPKPKAFVQDSCDQLILLDGREEKIKVIEINSTDVKYKKCDFQEGPTYVVPRSDVFMIKYINGTKELFNKPNQASAQHEHLAPREKPVQAKKTTPYIAKIAYVLGIVNAATALVVMSFLPIVTEMPPLALICFLLIAAITLILSLQANKEIRMNRTELRGFGLTIPAMIVSSIVLLVFLLLATFVF